MRIHEINHGFVQSQLIEDDDRLTLVDTGIAGEATRVVDEVRRIGRDPSDLREIIVTHAHPDHTGSLAELVSLTGARVLAHRLDAPVVRGHAAICPPVLSELEKPYFEEASSRTMPAAACEVDRELDDGETLDVAAGAVVVHVPGHTPGSIAVYVPALRLVFCGDAAATLNDRVMVGFFNCDPALAARSFARLAELDIEAAYFGHGDPVLKDASTMFRRLAERIVRTLDT